MVLEAVSGDRSVIYCEGDVEIGCLSGWGCFPRDVLDFVRKVEKGVEFVHGGVETVVWIEETYSKWVAEMFDGLEGERHAHV